MWRRCGSVIVAIDGRRTVEDVLFAEDDDPVYVGWHVLAGVNLRVDERSNTLVDRGPIPAASISRRMRCAMASGRLGVGSPGAGLGISHRGALH
ncbi:MAG TPA: hypothetical protein VFT29_17955 [Gemmatimonadaceae bacterium]|nr:hypothetical protein [Gemmatimonadaceae bacterium]